MGSRQASMIDTIICGDCLEVMSNISSGSVHAIITDPPFTDVGGFSKGRASITDVQFFSHWWRDVCKQLVRILIEEGSGFIWCDWRTAAAVANGFADKTEPSAQWRVTQMIHHYREMPGMGKPFRNSVDMIAYLRGPKHKLEKILIPATTRNFISKYWYYGRHKYHVAEKSVDICEELLNWCSSENDVILDPFAGSGTTAVACKRLNRHYICIEKEQEYCAIAEKRLAEML